MPHPAVAAFLIGLSNPNSLTGQICGHQVDGVAGLFDTLLDQDGGQIIIATPDLVAVSDAQRQRVWTVGKLPDATPAVVCREVVKAGGLFKIDIHALCYGSDQECRAFVDRFRG